MFFSTVIYMCSVNFCWSTLLMAQSPRIIDWNILLAAINDIYRYILNKKWAGKMNDEPSNHLHVWCLIRSLSLSLSVSPQTSDSHPSRLRLGWDSKTSGEKFISHGKPYNMHCLAYFTLLDTLVILNTLHNVEDHDNHVIFLWKLFSTWGKYTCGQNISLHRKINVHNINHLFILYWIRLSRDPSIHIMLNTTIT